MRRNYLFAMYSRAFAWIMLYKLVNYAILICSFTLWIAYHIWAKIPSITLLYLWFEEFDHRYRISIYRWYISRNIAWEWNKILSCYIYIPPVEYISRHGLLNNTDWFVAEKIRQIIFYDTCNYFLCEIPSGERKKTREKMSIQTFNPVKEIWPPPFLLHRDWRIMNTYYCR